MATRRGSEGLGLVEGGSATARWHDAHAPARGRRRRPSTARGGVQGGHELSIPIRRRGTPGARPFERLDDDHPAAAAGAAPRGGDVFGRIVGLARGLGRALRRGEQLSGSLDVVRPHRAGQQAVMSDAVKAARQHVQEKAADELVCVERHRLEPVAPFDAVILTWGASGQGGDSFMRPPAHLVGSVRLFGLCQRRSIFGRWLLAAKMASARRGSRMRSTGEAGVRGAQAWFGRMRRPATTGRSGSFAPLSGRRVQAT